MLNAEYFTYDGKQSSEYGLKIADFNDNRVVEANAFSPTLKTIKPVGLVRSFHNGIDFEASPQHQFSILSESKIDNTLRREILSWLIGRNEFKDLEIGDPNTSTGDFYKYKCVFTNADIIYVNGRCHGFRLTANFDSPYARGADVVASNTDAGATEKYNVTVTLEDDNVYEVKIKNPSDIVDGYVYPKVQFTGDSIKITNTTDDQNRVFEFSGLASGESGESVETITVDNETKHISSNFGGEKLSYFKQKNWLRLRRGENVLKVETAPGGTFTITCPHYAMIGV